jgi:hypothetical protein
LEGFTACHDLNGTRVEGVYVQSVDDIGRPRLGRAARPVTEIGAAKADVIFVPSFDAAKASRQIEHLAPAGAEVVSLDQMRVDEDRLSNPADYLDPLNFVTNFAFFRDGEGRHTRLTTANYWSNYGAERTAIHFVLFDADGAVLARWSEPLRPTAAVLVVDSRDVRARFDLAPFEGQLFMHVSGAKGHDVMKYALDVIDDAGPSLSCTHDANAWPADLYAGLPAPREDETVILWLQNSLPLEIPAGEIALSLMGDNRRVAYERPIAPFASVPLSVACLLPDARWPQQIEIAAGRYMVRSRYEVVRGERRRIAHVNVERSDLRPDPELRRLGPLMGKGHIIPAPILPPE